MKTEQLTLEYLEQMTDPTKFKSFKVKLKEGASPKIKLRKTAKYTVQSVQKPSNVFKNYQLHIGRNWYNADMFRLVSDQDKKPIGIETLRTFPENYKIPKDIQVICLGRSLYASRGDKGVTLEECDTPFVQWENGRRTAVCSEVLAPLNPSDHPDYQPDHSVTEKLNGQDMEKLIIDEAFQPEPIHPDNQTVATLIQYVSEHKDKMSKESINHFASLIGLIKLGAL